MPVAHPIADIVEQWGAGLAEAFRSTTAGRPINVDATAPGRGERPFVSLSFRGLGRIASLNSSGQAKATQICHQEDVWAPHQPELEKYSQGARRQQVVSQAWATHPGVESTARQRPRNSGFQRALAIDAMKDTECDAHHNRITRIFQGRGRRPDHARDSSDFRSA